MYTNPMASLLLRLLGQAASQQFSQNANKDGQGNGQGYGTPFDSMFGGQQPVDDSPINVEAEVIDADGKTQEDRIHEDWDNKRKAEASHQLNGTVVFEGSHTYNVLVGVISVILLLCGVAARIYSLINGVIFSAAVVPVALGAIAGVLMGIAGVVLIWRKGAYKMLFSGVDLVLVFLSAALMGYFNLFAAALSLAVCYAYMRLRGNGSKLPFIAAYAVFAIVLGLAIHFPGLVF